MKVGIYSPYLDSLGGGERYILTAAEFFVQRGDRVHIFWDGQENLDTMAKRFALNLSGASLTANPFAKAGLLKKIQQTSGYDLILILSDGSVPLSFAHKNWIHLQVPFQKSNRPKNFNRLKLRFFEHVLCNSQFTKKIIDQTYGVVSTVVYPPVDVDQFVPGKKENLILNVARFFAPSHIKNYTPKKQQELIEAFKKMVDQGLKEWKLVLLGSALDGQQTETQRLMGLSKGYPVEIKANVDFADLQKTFSKASLYWHATGFGEDLAAFPERAEHFGITTVEAMAAGAVPVVFAGGGQMEIVEPGLNGLFWQSQGELIKNTSLLIRDLKLRRRMAQNAQNRAKDFSKEKFFANLKALL